VRDLFGHCGCGNPIEVPERHLCFACYRHQQDRGADIVGLRVRLARDIDRTNPCCNNVAIIQPGRATHVGAFYCATCGSHRGWMSQAAHSFILETVRRFGAPSEPIVVRQTERNDPVQFDNINRGALFRESDKQSDKDRDYSGNINVNGEEFWLSGWVKTSKKGTKYLSPASSLRTQGGQPNDD
jgi:hypothetical protein